MDDDLLKYYSKELGFLRKSAAGFAKQNPNAASRLRISPDAIEDPHVERLIQSVAFLNGRIRKKLDDEYPELTDAFLNVLYPHYLGPVPSMSIVKMQADKGLAEDYLVPKGALLETPPVEGDPLIFRTAYPVRLWPFDVSRAELVEGAFKAPPVPVHLNPVAIIRLELKTFADDIAFSTLKPEKLRFYLRGEASVVNPLYYLILNHVSAIAIADDAVDTKPTYAGPESIKPVGFAEDENLLDYSPRSFDGYRLLTEYFAFPQKFNFIEIDGLGKKWKTRKGKVELYLYLDKTLPDLHRGISKETFALGCTPIVNLFKQIAEPISVTGYQNEYHLVADSRNMLHKEIVSIDEVKATTLDGNEIPIRPFYGFSHSGVDADTLHWFASRRRAPEVDAEHIDPGTETYISLVDRDYLAQSPHKWVLNVKVTCSNRDLPKRLPFGGGQPALHLQEGGLVEQIECLMPPTATRRPSFSASRSWKLISHLTLNQMPLLAGPEGVAALKELLKLYDFDDSQITQSLINSIVDISYRQIASRVRAKGNTALCRGLEVTVTLDENRFKDQSMYLFGAVLERFFALAAPLNSFTKMVIRTKQKNEIYKKWKPRAAHVQLA